MSPILGNLIVLVALAIVVALAIRSLWRSHKQGGHCNGNCACCGGCYEKRDEKRSPDTPL